jgi:hypothetical protein
MRHSFTLLAALVIVLVDTTPPAAQQRPGSSGPQPPGGRLVSTSQDCSNLQKEWDAYKDFYGKQHQACLDSYKSNVQAGPTCSKAPCQQLHYIVYEYGSSESSRMMNECRDAVSKIQKQKAEYDAAVRRYNQQIAEHNRRLLQEINRQNAQIAEQNRLAQQAVEQRNRAAQQMFQDLMREYNLPPQPADGSSSPLQSMREALRGVGSQLSNQVSNLVNELGAVTFDDAVNGLSDASSTFGSVFETAHAVTDLDPPEQVTSVLDRIDRWTAAWNIFQAGRTSLSDTATPQERFDSQISGLSSSTTFLFTRTPWAGGLASDSIEGIGRWANSSWGLFENTLNGAVPTDDEIKDAFARSFFPGIMWLKDKADQIEGKRDQVYEFFGR